MANDHNNFEFRLAEEVKKHLNLYDSSHVLYKDQYAAANSWREIAETLGTNNPETCKKKWTAIRDKFVKARKRTKGRSEDAGRKRTPALLLQLPWLDRHVKHGKTEANMPSSPDDEEMMDCWGPVGGDTQDGTVTDENEDESVTPQGVYLENLCEGTNQETEVKLECPPPIPVPFKVTVVGSTHPAAKQSISQSASRLPFYPSSIRARQPRKRHSDVPLEKLLESFLEQNAQAEKNFYQLEEQRLQAEDRRRETEHSLELHTLQMLRQMISGIATLNPASASTCAPPTTRTRLLGPTSVPPSAPSTSTFPLICRQTGHFHGCSSNANCFCQTNNLLYQKAQSQGSSFCL